MVLVVLPQIGAKDLTVHGLKQQKPLPIQTIKDFQTNLGCKYSLRLSSQLQPVKTRGGRSKVKKSLTVPSFTALAVLLPDCQKSGLVVLRINFLQSKLSFAQHKLYSSQTVDLADTSQTTVWYA